jgi:acyl transferase domain-containing protein/NADPH:quinone reductase-like Zn-dependent oxidoreductase/acyl carrier protein
MDVAPIEKFAIVGIGCRMPPNASSLASFWRFLLRGGNALRPHRKDRWDWRQFFDADPQRPGKTYAPKSASLDGDVQQFDPLAFGISPREAASLDPQQRLLLEVTWEAFEDAGLPLERMSGSATGVFVGGFCLDHLVLQAQPSNRHLINAHSAGGVMMTVLSNRISHAFNLKGPSLTLDTACSSSLVALHYACQSLRLRECDVALAGGVNVMTRPEFPIIMSKGHFLSPHGECHTFDETAAGYARGEGSGILVLKRLDDALAAGDSIHAVVRASGVNQDGRTDGISLPNSEAQEALVRQVYATSGVPFAEVDYIEAHGTGTQAGDTAELGALNRNFAAGRADKLFVGSVKSNIGHLEAAAGVAGVLKAIGVLKHRQIPKNLHFKTPNPKIPFDEYCFEVAGETRKLPAAEEKPTLYAAVNSFGYGGTNAHVLLESAPAAETASAPDDGAKRLIPFSACSEEALRDLAGKFAFLIGQGLAGSLADLAYTTAFRRSHLPVRLTTFAGDLEQLRDQLIAASTGQPHESVATGGKGGSFNPALVFVYTGMGPQWWAMGRELIRDEPVIAAAIDEVDAHFRVLAGWSLKEAMLADESASRMARTELAQPANFALQVALTRLWAAHGIRPAAVVGHSVGEVTAAYVAGVYTLAEAVAVSYHRSRLQQTAAGQGAMLAVGLAEDEALREIAAMPAVSVAAINSFNAVTLSGDKAQLEQVAAALEARGVFNKFLRVEVAYHSPQMDPLRDELLAALADLAPQPATLPLYSTAHGKIVPGETWDAEYWWHNVRQAVRFADATRLLIEDGFSAFVEVGPHPVLGNSIKECAAAMERKVSCFTSLRRAEPERPRFLLTLGELYCAGIDPDWSALAPTAGRFIPGPQYPWQRQTHWVESDRSRMERLGLPGPVYLNRSVLAPNPTWEVEINRNYFPFLFDHGVQDQTVFAGLGYIEAGLTLSRQVHGKPGIVLENVSFEHVLIVDYATLQYLVTEFEPTTGRFVVSSRVEGVEDSFQRHCTGRMLPQSEPVAERLDVAELRSECPDAVDVDAFHEHLVRCELHYGPAFRPITEVWTGENCYLLRIDASIAAAEEAHLLHPTLFDAAIRGVLYCASGERLFVPFSFEQFEYFSRPESAECYAFGRLLSESDTMLVADVWLMDAAGHVHAHARRMTLQAIDMKATGRDDALFHRPEWKAAALEEPAELESFADVVILAAGNDDELVAGLPGAAVMRLDSAGEGFATEAISQRLSAPECAGRNRLVVLPGDGDELAESERLIGILQAAAAVHPAGAEVTLVTRGAKPVEESATVANLAQYPLSGIAFVAQNEFPELRCRSVDLPADADGNAADWIRAELGGGSRGDVAYREGQRFVSVLSPFRAAGPAPKVFACSVEEPIEAILETKGKPESLSFRPTQRVEPAGREIELRVHQVALNYKDLLKLEGRLHPGAFEDTFNGAAFGMECAGVVVRCGPGSAFKPGDRVVTIVTNGFRSFATVPEEFAVPIPEGFGMEMAAIPVVYLAAYHGLVDVARLQPGERVLIHHGTGGLGLAAITIARWIGAEIFATAGSDEKQRYLRDQGIAHVYSSRSLDFGPRIREATQGEGVDVVIGAQTAQAMHVGLAALRVGGRYIEIGKKDIVEDNALPLRAFNRNLVFASIDMDLLARERPRLVQDILRTVFAHFAAGRFSLGPVRTFPAREIREAFAEMARSAHIGKLLVDFSEGEVEVVAPTQSGPAVKRDGCYVVTGGTSGFGLATGRWLAEQGAGKVVLASRSGNRAPGIAETVRAMETAGAQVEVAAVDVTEPAQVRALIERAGAGPFALRGIVHGAMVLDDVMMADLTEERFRQVFRPKALGAMNLAAALEGVAGLDFLIFDSSVSALIGNPGQTSYVAANGLLDGLAHALRARSVPAVSINWGALAETGVIARDERLGVVLSAAGITGLDNRAAFAAMERAIRLAEPQLGVFLVDWEKWHAANPGLSDDPRFRELHGSSADGGNDAATAIRRTLADASKEQRLRAIEDCLQDVLANTLKMAKDTVPVDRKLNEMGVDSLLVLELSLGISERIGVNFSAMEFLKGPNLQQLAAMAEGRLWKNGQ